MVKLTLVSPGVGEWTLDIWDHTAQEVSDSLREVIAKMNNSDVTFSNGKKIFTFPKELLKTHVIIVEEMEGDK